jgi:hypothetical protein
MNKPKISHTPGPWNRGYGNCVYQGEHPAPTGQRLIAVCEPTTREPEDWEETFENAHLISLAPDMKQAISRALYHLEGQEYLDAAYILRRTLKKIIGE